MLHHILGQYVREDGDVGQSTLFDESKDTIPSRWVGPAINHQEAHVGAALLKASRNLDKQKRTVTFIVRTHEHNRIRARAVVVGHMFEQIQGRVIPDHLGSQDTFRKVFLYFWNNEDGI